MFSYPSKTVYSKDQELMFPDFTVIYLGDRHVDHEIYKNGFHYRDFLIKSSDQEQVVSWTSGTGEIVPHNFTVDDKCFYLELGLSDSFGALNSNELVIGIC